MNKLLQAGGVKKEEGKKSKNLKGKLYVKTMQTHDVLIIQPIQNFIRLRPKVFIFQASLVFSYSKIIIFISNTLILYLFPFRFTFTHLTKSNRDGERRRGCRGIYYNATEHISKQANSYNKIVLFIFHSISSENFLL